MHLIMHFNSEIHIIAGDCNGHVGKECVTFNIYHGGKGYVTRNPEWLRISDLCCATNLAVSNTFLTKIDTNQSHSPQLTATHKLITFWLKRSFLKHVCDIKVNV